MKKIFVVILLLILVACASTPTIESTMKPTIESAMKPTIKPTIKPTFLVYTVTRETGFYASATSDDYTVTVTRGTKVKPANNVETLTCKTVDVYGVSITLCNIEIISTGKTGWILKNALERD